MNKVVLIGNGFDKAHKMETSYQEFIIHYLRNSMQFAFENQWYSDENIELTINKTFY
ncbi:MAG: hypothetical protein HWD58_20760 [Bacteroidota bacterium]|nr:MAG: hypothetical protein HWD58_20760 [Bacteroidota bacterium]